MNFGGRAGIFRLTRQVPQRSEIMTIDNKEKSTESQSTPTKRDADTIEPGSENKKRKIDQTQAILEKIKRSSPKKESSQSVFA